jgi:hypothetical protein
MPAAITLPDHVKAWGELNKQQWPGTQPNDIAVQHRHRYDHVIDDRNETGFSEGVRQRAHVPPPQLKLRPGFVLGRTLGRNESADDELLADEIAFNMGRPREPRSQRASNRRLPRARHSGYQKRSHRALNRLVNRPPVVQYHRSHGGRHALSRKVARALRQAQSQSEPGRRCGRDADLSHPDLGGQPDVVGQPIHHGQRGTMGALPFSCWAIRWGEDGVTVYAYEVRHQQRWAGGLSDPWFDLTADSEAELHEFAARLGLSRQGFQPGTPVGPQQVSVSWHYTVTASERDRAIELGARAITQREVISLERQRAADQGVI